MTDTPFTLSDAEWRAPDARTIRIMRQHGAERPGSCGLLREKRAGVFAAEPARISTIKCRDQSPRATGFKSASA